MAIPSLKDVRTGIITAVKRLKKINGYTIDLPDSHIYPVWKSDLAQNTDDELYPKCFIFSDKGKMRRLVAGQKERNFKFVVIVVVKKVAESEKLEPSETAELIINDVETIFDKDDTLGGLVTDIQIVSFATDSGFCHPEGIAILDVEVEMKTSPR